MMPGTEIHVHCYTACAQRVECSLDVSRNTGMGCFIWHSGIQNNLKTSHVLEQINLKLLPSNFTTSAFFLCYFVGITRCHLVIYVN
jgi:hypothetical protein